MFRSALAAGLGAFFGCVAIGPMRERMADQLMQPVEAWSVGAVVLLAMLIALFLMACREPREPRAAPPSRLLRPDGAHRGVGVKSPRDASGRFASR